MADSAERRSPLLTDSAWLKTLPPAGRWILHGDAEVRRRAERSWGVAFSEAACRAVTSAQRATLWLGPDEYLLLDLAAPVPAGTAVTADALEAALQGLPHALVDVGHRQFAIEVSGPHAEELLLAGCPLDLDAGAFPVGMCTRTVFSKADIVLWRTRADAFHVEIWRSFAGYVGGLLEEIAREYYPTPVA
jgi:sarcosine oxidase, subunit gamma